MSDAAEASHRFRQPKRIVTVHEACDEAATLLRSAGFVLANASLRSEAAYYRLPGRDGVIRVAAHPQHGSKPMVGLDRILARLTFLPHRLCRQPDTLVLTEPALRGIVCGAIGRYMIGSAAGQGPQSLWRDRTDMQEESDGPAE